MNDAEKVTVRPEEPADKEAIDRVHVAAFATHPYSHQTEHLIVNALREADALTVTLVAEVSGEVVGHIAFSPMTIDHHDHGWYLLGPVAVLPRYQRRGVGKALVLEGLQAIRRLGANGCALVGEPAYYSRFGFTNVPELTFEGIPPEFCMGVRFAGEMPRGRVSHHEAFSIKPADPA